MHSFAVVSRYRL